MKWFEMTQWPGQERTEQVPIQHEWDRDNHKDLPPCAIPRWLAEIAYTSYVNHGGRGQSLDRLCERGGFGRSEFLAFLCEALNEAKEKKV